MNCKECENLFEDALDGHAEKALRKRMKLHLSHCDECRAKFANVQFEYKMLFGALNSPACAKRIPQGFSARLLAAMEAKKRRALRWRRIVLCIAASLTVAVGAIWALGTASAGAGRGETAGGGDAGPDAALARAESVAPDLVSQPPQETATEEAVGEPVDATLIASAEVPAPVAAPAAEEVAAAAETVAAAVAETATETQPAIDSAVAAVQTISTTGKEGDTIMDTNENRPGAKKRRSSIYLYGLGVAKSFWRSTVTASAMYMATANAGVNTQIPRSDAAGSFADGKVVVTCNGSANVTKIVAKPSAGETLTMAGSAVTFADGAYIMSRTETDGKTYTIDTGYLMNPNTCIVADFEFTARTADVFPDNTYQQYVFETSSEGGGVARIYVNGTTGTGGISWNLSEQNDWRATGCTMSPGDRYVMTLDGYHRRGTLLVNGSQVYSANIPAADTVLTANRTLRLFGNVAGTGNAAMMKLYRFTIYESDVLVHDYVPALRDGVAGMYDLVADDFLCYSLDTTTTFAYGGDILEIEEDAYIESLGGGMMNSRFCMAPDAKVEIDYALTDTADPTPAEDTHYQQRVFGADTAAFAASYYINGSGNMAFGVGDAFVPCSTGYKANYGRHRAVIDVPGDRFYYMTHGMVIFSGTISGNGATATNTAKHALALFGNMSSVNGASFAGGRYRSKAKIYGFKCWKAGELVHDYVPCVKGGAPGFKDLVDGAFITAENIAQLRAGGKGLIVEDDDGYISSSGNDAHTGYRFLETGYTVTPHTRLELDYALADNYPSGSFSDVHTWDFFAAGEAGETTSFCVYCNTNGFGWSGCGIRWKSWTGGTLSKPITGKDVRRTVIVDNHTGFSGVITAGFTNLYSNVSPADESIIYTKPLRLASNNNGADWFTPLKIYGLKLYESGTLTRNYEPCVTNGAAALHDTLTDTFLFTPPKYTAFVAGGNITNFDGKCDAYLESDGTQAINTEYLVKGSETRIEADFAFLDTHIVGNNYQQRAFGKRWMNTDTKEIDAVFYINGSGNFMFAFGNAAQNTHGPGVAADSLRHTAVIDGYHSRLHFITGGVTNNTYDVSGDAHNANSTLPLCIFNVCTDTEGTSWQSYFSKLRLYTLRVYEKDELLHEYIPYKKGETVGLYDTLTGEVKTDACNSATPFKIAGMGVDGAERWIVPPKNRKITKPVMLSVNAVGALFYRWTRNGEPVDGGEDGDLTVEWIKGGGIDKYTITPVYDVYGCEVEGAPATFTLEHASHGTAIVII